MSSAGRQSQKKQDELFDIAEPRASAMIESLRAFGYNIQTAIADLIDNSITAKAKNVWLEFSWNGTDSFISIRDDGKGMSEGELVSAMRPGSQSPLEERDQDDLGRFGLGLKTASFSQCRRLTVASRTRGSATAVRRWDLDYVNQTDQWRLLRSAAPGSESRLVELETMTAGTIVLWECMDRVVGDARASDRGAHDHFLETAETVEHHLAMVFHRFLEKRNCLKIWINGNPVKPWDPFLVDEKATQALPEEKFSIRRRKLLVQPYVLPHHSKIDQGTHTRAAGPAGWNAQQGFYVYRNERLLVPGDWLGLGFQKEEHCKLARIRVDLPNSLDDEWNIDIKKSRARPPASLKSDLRRIARATRQRAVEIYRHRGKVIARENAEKHVFPWDRKIRRGKIFYSINQEHPLVQQALNLPGEHKSTVRALIRLLEETVPVQQIWIDASTDPEKHSQPFEGTPTKEVLEVINEIYRTFRKNGLTPAQARDRILTMEPFQHFETLVSRLSD
ncbi:ATP-binding protein [Leptolyngbya sp. ST-U4]|uniref:ATP-binding protein n=1 Tax=Leptolyngbya sp. ST-U4 TaxID=2933912 RepID=UPI003298B7EF